MENFRRTIALAALANCWSGGASAQELNGTSWHLSKSEGEVAVGETRPVLSFDADGSVSGDAGCNQFTARFVTNASSILLSPLATTMMICDDAVSEREARFLTGLQQVREFEISEDSLVLRDAAATPVLTLTSN